MRKVWWGSLPVAICMLSCSEQEALPQEYRVIFVDEAHAMGKETDPAPYLISPGIGLILDARGFDFANTPSPGVQPNAVHVAIGDDKIYTAPWDPSNVVNLYSKTLVAIGDSRPFRGLFEGDTAVLVIGAQSFDEKERKIVMNVLWGGLIKVSAETPSEAPQR
ncbi:MAG TPA: hypothetical protein PLM14_04205 [Candidatus Hydrogenedentes bacterium]|nr:hypothetical protein [Candidatus Hydrogenedentota bacterium]HQE82178.1 hypothetical protein [Candidatus Hydrogenedentota bacterium]HQH53164.1 hypothetical protein [Candidatus Hydrogenedentota bacterium]HQM48272.1 hypothetical protein [Candidatus Hydrogenedentota bacterium]